METEYIAHGSDIFKECINKDVYIYGAKFSAIKLSRFLKHHDGVIVKGFIVSQKYDNPDFLEGKEVLRIEENKDRHFECVVVAVGENFVWNVINEIQEYNIDKLIILNPLADDVLCERIISDKSRISKKIFLDKTVRIDVDETSCLIIDDNVLIDANTSLIVENNSIIRISSGCRIGRNCFFKASGASDIEIGSSSCIRDDTRFFCINDSELSLQGKNEIDMYGEITCNRHSNVSIGERTIIGQYCRFGANNTNIQIGADCMFSFRVGITSGAHCLKDENDRDITNHSPVVLGNHVWVGMASALLGGCEILDESVVGACSLVNKKIPNNSVCVGIPAKVIRTGIKWKM